jgi:predicted nucleic acid-binding protein
MRFLLDTNIVSDLVRHPQGKIADLISTVGEKEVCTSIIVAAELRFGAAKKKSPQLTAQLDAVLAAMDVIVSKRPLTPFTVRSGRSWSVSASRSAATTCSSPCLGSDARHR